MIKRKVMNAPKGGSSHYTFRKAGCQPITIPKHEPIKKVYVEMVKQIVESETVNDYFVMNYRMEIVEDKAKRNPNEHYEIL